MISLPIIVQYSIVIPLSEKILQYCVIESVPYPTLTPKGLQLVTTTIGLDYLHIFTQIAVLSIKASMPLNHSFEI